MDRDDTAADFRCGRVALVGRPNVGKSTLLNALVGSKLSIVSPKPQTTRHRILGIATRPDAQLIYLDTPGLHADGRRAMNRQLNRVARHVPDEADVVVHVVEALKWTDEDALVWDVVRKEPKPALLVVSKVDRVTDKTRLLPFAEATLRDRPYAGVHYVDALHGKGVERLERDLIARLPLAPPAFAEDELTDRSERFLASELVREQLMLRLNEELPYATTVEIEQFEDSAKISRIAAAIWVEREGQKAIVIGAGGAQLKAIGKAARLEMERLFDRRVHLELWVKVRERWSDDEAALKRFGYFE